jgi:hypothetical protein
MFLSYTNSEEIEKFFARVGTYLAFTARFPGPLFCCKEMTLVRYFIHNSEPITCTGEPLPVGLAHFVSCIKTGEIVSPPPTGPWNMTSQITISDYVTRILSHDVAPELRSCLVPNI